MPVIRYPQFCALARAAELLGQRWTLLIIRELLLDPKRFTDLRARLDGVSTSVLSERLTHLEDANLIRRTFLEPPAASTVYELTEDGTALKPVVFELIRWGGRFLMPQRPGERVEPDWMRLAMAAYVPKGPTPERSFNIRIPTGQGETVVHVRGGPDGTTIAAGSASADVDLTADFPTVLGLTVGRIEPSQALSERLVRVDGDVAALADFPQLFDSPARQR